MRYIYCLSLDEAYDVISKENAKQNTMKTFYNITLRKTKNGKFAVIIGG